ncbi:hypothetical protein RRG08_022861 [Elysia crispata]|uniref:Uncharacterized protein n=1 Tax=Elysia crispata TaxID=231223 RepID=A0AAE0Z0J8_9GAST|nr:hypothetical protein RRG08_022861 [Elysia crispata]
MRFASPECVFSHTKVRKIAGQTTWCSHSQRYTETARTTDLKGREGGLNSGFISARLPQMSDAAHVFNSAQFKVTQWSQQLRLPSGL